MRRALDGLYAASGALAVVFLVLIAVLTLSQVFGRVFGIVIPSADDFAGFCMAGSVFLGLTYTLRSGGHVRVRTLLAHVGVKPKLGLEILCAAASVAIIATLVWYAVDMILVTRRLGEFTLGLVPVPKWIPMILMLVGLAIFLIALIDDLVQLLRGRKASYMVREDASESSIPAAAE